MGVLFRWRSRPALLRRLVGKVVVPAVHIALIVLGYVFTLIPKRRKLIVFQSTPDFSDAPRYLVEYLVSDRRFESWTLVFVVSATFVVHDSVPQHLRNRIIFVKKYSLTHFLFASRAAVFVTTHGIPALFRSDATFIEFWHGVPLKDISPRSPVNRSIVSKIMRIRWRLVAHRTFFVSPSRIYSILFLYSIGLPITLLSRALEVGHPRYDFLRRNMQYRDKHRSTLLGDVLGIGCDDNRRVIVYLPTFRDNRRDPRDSDYYLSLVRDVFSAFDPEKYILVAELHPFVSKHVLGDKPFIPFNGGYILNSAYYDVYSLILASDLLVTDYSSIFFDYLVLDQPIVFYVPDLRRYADDRGFILEPISAWLPGHIVISRDDLKVLSSLEDVVSVMNKEYLSKRHILRDVLITYWQNCSLCAIADLLLSL